MTEPTSVRDVLEMVTRRLGLSYARETGALWGRWSEIVGPVIAAHAHPSSLRGGVLRIRTESSLWATEIGYLRSEIQDKVNRALGAQIVSEVRVWTGPASAPGGRSPNLPPVTRTQKGDDKTKSQEDPLTALRRAKRAWAVYVNRSRERRAQ